MSSRLAVNPRQAETVERLLAAGLDELRAVGVDRLTIRSVAVRAGVSSATAYTYFASKNHLFAELFWREVSADRPLLDARHGVVRRVQTVTRHLASMLAAEPHLAVAANHALLGTDAEVDRLRTDIGAELVRRFRDALGPAADPAVLDALTYALTGALLQAGMGLIDYADLPARLDRVVAAILEGTT